MKYTCKGRSRSFGILVIGLLLIITYILIILPAFHAVRSTSSRMFVGLFLDSGEDPTRRREFMEDLKFLYLENEELLEEDMAKLKDIDKVFMNEALDNTLYSSPNGFFSRENGLQSKMEDLYNKLDTLLENQEEMQKMQRDIFIHQQTDVVGFKPLKGYDDNYSTDGTHPADPDLLDTIQKRIDNHPRFMADNHTTALDSRDWRFQKVIHRSWVDTEIPSKTVTWIKKWKTLHPGWTFIFWTDASARKFVQDYFPGLMQTYDSWTLPIHRSDMFRYIALYAFGGVFADMDMEVLRRMHGVRSWSSCVFSRKPDIQSYVVERDLNTWANNYTTISHAFIACRSHHPFLYYLISRSIVQAQKPPCSISETSSCSESEMASLAYGYYKRSLGLKRLEDKSVDVICPESDFFLPTNDQNLDSIAKEKCEDSSSLTPLQRYICKVWQSKSRQPRINSFTTHHWLHSSDLTQNKTDIREVVKDVLIWSERVKSKHFVLLFR